jgi:hypothetical protein
VDTNEDRNATRKLNFQVFAQKPQFVWLQFETMTLRVSNRLLEFLELRGFRVHEVTLGDNAHPRIAHVTECEIDWEPPPVANAGPSADFCISFLTRFNNEPEISYDFGIIDHYGIPDRKDTAIPLQDGRRFDILWLSADLFVTLREFPIDNRTHVELMYSTGIKINGIDLELRAYRLVPANGQGEEERPTPDVPLRFFAHLLVPIFHVLQRIVVYLRATPLVEAALLLVPTISQNITKQLKVTLFSRSDDLLRALGSHPVHPRVLLCLAGHTAHQELNDQLRAFQFPINLCVPRKLLCREITGESFAVNPAIISLTIDAGIHGQLSSTLIDGIARNGGITHLTMKCSDWLNFDARNSEPPSWIGTVFRRVLLSNTSRVESITLVSIYNSFDFSDYYLQIHNLQDSFDKLAHQVCSQSTNRHGLSSFRLTFPKSSYKPCITSSELWDSQFVPSLLLNRLSEHAQGCPGLMVQRINQGVLYRSSTNLIPCNLSTSSASAIFLILGRLIRKESAKGDEDLVQDGLNECCLAH